VGGARRPASEASYIPPAKYPAIHRAAVEACDGNDGLKDGLIDDPRQCRFDPQALQCTAADGDSCLTAPQVAAARQIYSPAMAPASKKEIFPGLQRGGELGWDALAGPRPIVEAVEFFQYVVVNDPAWDFKTLSFDTAAELADKAAGDVLNVVDPNLKPFFDRGGKLLLYTRLERPVRVADQLDQLLHQRPRRASDQGQAGRLESGCSWRRE
jgi:feruloyl esterase